MSFESQPTLTGALVSIRPLQADDLGAFWSVASDPLIWEQHPAKERAEEDGFRAFFAESLATGGALVVHDAATGAVIGSSRHHGYNADGSFVHSISCSGAMHADSCATRIPAIDPAVGRLCLSPGSRCASASGRWSRLSLVDGR